MMTRAATLLVAFLTLAGTAAAQDWPDGFACAFNKGHAASQTAGAFTETDAAPLSFEIAGIDLDGQAAQIISKPGSPPGVLRVVRALNANHFIEVLSEGFLGLTTIYDKLPSGLYPAVHSRHVGVMGEALVAQYTGTCTPR